MRPIWIGTGMGSGCRSGRLVMLGALALAGIACGGSATYPGETTPGSGGGGDGGSGSLSGSDGGAGSGQSGPWVELARPTLSVQGGAALSPGGQGQPGGVVHLVSSGDTDFGPGQPAVAAPSIPATPAGATAVGASALATDATVSGDAVL